MHGEHGLVCVASLEVFLVLLSIFQAIFDWSSIPMDFIDSSFAQLSEWTKQQLPPGVFTDFIAEGVISGLGGIVIFIPQIALLFMFISILEETGYMSRVVFLMDRGLRKFGLSGKSVVRLISGTACAIPAVMATRIAMVSLRRAKISGSMALRILCAVVVGPSW